MSVLGDFYRYEQGELRPLMEPTGDNQLAVADSWLVTDGKVRSLEAHFDRFANWVLKIEPDLVKELSGFFAEVSRLLPREGRWFPRMEYHAEEALGKRLFLRLREAPVAMESVTLFSYPEPDPRHKPHVKGPDLSLCQQLRRLANMNGADEAVITDENGFVAEGALSALVWWRGDTLCSSNNQTNWLPSITRQEVFQIAEQIGILYQLENSRPGDIAKLPIWALSSLNGIMPVRAWVGLNDSCPQSHHLDAFNKRLRLLSRQV